MMEELQQSVENIIMYPSYIPLHNWLQFEEGQVH